MTPNEQVIYDILCHAANRGAPCPSNGDMAFALECESIGTPPNIMRRLERRGLISVRRLQCARQVTIAATGQATAEPASRTIHWRLRNGGQRREHREAVAEMCSEGHSLPAIADLLKLSKSYVRVLFQEVRRDLGWQAV